MRPGTQLGPYEILEPLGKGGMGEVYRAHDRELGRDVAIKVLPEELAADERRLGRLRREARSLAALNHPGIATVFGFEEHEDTRFIVMELVEGKTLAERLRRGALPVEEALGLGLQIARALEAAHQRGIVHRDLKPSNVKVTPSGDAKVLDFGLAKPLRGPATGPDAGVGRAAQEGESELPTATVEATRTGTILGTAAYMSPEQARGEEVDTRTDVWAFGCLVYEMLSGESAFAAATPSDTLAAVLTREPDWEELPGDTPWRARDLLRRSLRKNPEQRLQHIGDARIELHEALTAKEDESPRPPDTTPPTARFLPWAVAAATLALLGISLWAPWRHVSRDGAGAVRAELVHDLPTGATLPDLTEPPVLAISPDGGRIAYVIQDPEGRTQIYSRELARDDPTPIPGTAGGLAPFFSPNGEWLGFEAEGELRKVRLDRPDAGVVPLHELPSSLRGASWADDDTILFGVAGLLDLFAIPASGGSASERLTNIQSDEAFELENARWPDVLPDGQGVVFSLTTGMDFDESRIMVHSFRSGQHRLLLNASYARYVPTGHLVYARQDTLYAAPFDPDRLELLGEAEPVLAGVRVESSGPGSAHFAVSRTGTLVYLQRPERRSRVFLVDLEGNAEPLGAPALAYDRARFSPDGDRLGLVVRSSGVEHDIYVWDLARRRLNQAISRFRGPAGKEFKPGHVFAWSPDGSRLALNATGPGEMFPLFSGASDGSGDFERLAGGVTLPGVWFENGRRLLYVDQAHPSREIVEFDIFELDLDTGTSRPIFEAPGRGYRTQPALSPDARWLAYTSNESGQDEVYVTPFVNPGARYKVSAGGGASAAWSPDGDRLYYRAGSRMMAVDMTAAPQPGEATLLFDRRFLIRPVGTFPRIYDIHPDGRRFVMIEAPEEHEGLVRFKLVLDWFQELERLVPTGR